MKKVVFTILILATVLLYAAHNHKLKGKEIVAKGKKTSVSGELIYQNNDWFVRKGKKLILMHFGPENFLKDKGIEIKPVKKFSANGYLYKNAFAISSFTYNDTTIVLRDKNGKALWSESEHSQKRPKKIFYIVDAKKCIGCRLCVVNCPVNAIEMVNGRAVIDADKCIGCGICANGNGKNFKGCPVDAISKSE